MGQKAEACWAAMKAVHEGGEPTPERLAAISGHRVATVTRRAEIEGWRDPNNTLTGEQKVAYLQRGIDRLLRAIDADGRTKTKAAKLQPAQIDKMLASVKTMAKMADAIGPQEGTRKEDYSDADIAAAIALINQRIVELARYYAEELHRQGYQGQAGGVNGE